MSGATIDPKALEDAMLKALPSLFPNLLGTASSSRAEFYDKFQREADEYDNDFMKKYDEDLNSTLIFAGLFSAVTSAFIVDVQTNLQPDYQEMSFQLLRIVASASLGNTPTGADAAFPEWNGPDPTVAYVQAILYSSLAASLLAAFMAMLGKQWLSRYAQVDMHGSIVDRSRHRQCKINGMATWYFDFVMESLPLLLQAALLLLGYALSSYLFSMDKGASGVVIGFATFGLLFYFLITSAATFSYNCPFQTPFSLIIRSLIRLDDEHTRYLKRTGKWFRRNLFTKRRKSPGIKHDDYTEPPRANGGNPVGHTELDMEPPTLFKKDTDWDGYVLDSDCIAWMFKMSTDADVIMAIMKFVPEVVWHADIRTTPLEKVYDTVVECLDRSPGHPIVIQKFRDKAYLSAKALLHLAIQRKCIGEELDTFKVISDKHLPMSPLKDLDRDPDLTSTLGMIDCVFGNSEPMHWNVLSFTPTHHAWMGHILLYRAWYVLKQDKCASLPNDIKQFILHSFRLEPPPPTPIIADCLFMITLLLEIHVHRDDLSIVDKSSQIDARIKKIYQKLSKTFENLSPTNDTVIERALEALELISHLHKVQVASESYDLFRVVVGTSAPGTHSPEKWRVSRLAIHGAYKGDGFAPQVKEHQVETHQFKDTQYILAFLNQCFELATVKCQNQDEPIRNALCALVSDPAAIETLERFDPTKPSFVRGIQHAFHCDRPPHLHKAALLFLPLICDKWFNTRSPIMGSTQMRKFCMDWACAVDGVDQTPDVKVAILTVLLKMINSPRWCPHIVPRDWELLRDLTSLPDDFPPLLSCIDNPKLLNVIKSVDNPMAVAHWVATLWLKYAELTPDVRTQLEAVTMEIAQNERKQYFDTSQSRIGEYLSIIGSELKKAKEALVHYPTLSIDPAAIALKSKVGSLQRAAKALDAIKQGRSVTSP